MRAKGSNESFEFQRTPTTDFRTKSGNLVLSTHSRCRYQSISDLVRQPGHTHITGYADDIYTLCILIIISGLAAFFILNFTTNTVGKSHTHNFE